MNIKIILGISCLLCIVEIFIMAYISNEEPPSFWEMYKDIHLIVLCVIVVATTMIGLFVLGVWLIGEGFNEISSV